MRQRVAVILAATTAALAVLLVSLDLAWDLTARVDARDDGAWETVAETGGDEFNVYRGGPFDARCVDGEARLVVENGLPWAKTVDVAITYWNATTQRSITYLEDSWDLARFSDRELVFTLPADAFHVPGQDNGTRPPGKIYAGDLQVTVGGLFLSVCLEGPA